MTKCDRQGIRRIVLFGLVADLENRLQHTRYLIFGCVAVSGDGLFYFFRSIFRYRKIKLQRCGHRHTLGSPQFQHTLHILSKEGGFDGEFGGFVFADQPAYGFMDQLQPLDPLFGFARFKYPEVNQMHLLALHPNDAITHDHGTRVNP